MYIHRVLTTHRAEHRIVIPVWWNQSWRGGMALAGYWQLSEVYEDPLPSWRRREGREEGDGEVCLSTGLRRTHSPLNCGGMCSISLNGSLTEIISIHTSVLQRYTTVQCQAIRRIHLHLPGRLCHWSPDQHDHRSIPACMQHVIVCNTCIWYG